MHILNSQETFWPYMIHDTISTVCVGMRHCQYKGGLGTQGSHHHLKYHSTEFATAFNVNNLSHHLAKHTCQEWACDSQIISTGVGVCVCKQSLLQCGNQCQSLLVSNHANANLCTSVQTNTNPKCQSLPQSGNQCQSLPQCRHQRQSSSPCGSKCKSWPQNGNYNAKLRPSIETNANLRRSVETNATLHASVGMSAKLRPSMDVTQHQSLPKCGNQCQASSQYGTQH